GPTPGRRGARPGPPSRCPIAPAMRPAHRFHIAQLAGPPARTDGPVAGPPGPAALREISSEPSPSPPIQPARGRGRERRPGPATVRPGRQLAAEGAGYAPAEGSFPG